RLRPQGEADLLLRRPFGVAEEEGQELANAGRAPRLTGSRSGRHGARPGSGPARLAGSRNALGRWAGGPGWSRRVPGVRPGTARRPHLGEDQEGTERQAP